MSGNIEKTLRTILSASGRPLPTATGNPKLDKIATAVWVANQGRDTYQKVQAFYKQHTTWSVTVTQADEAYAPLQEWLVHNIPSKKQKNVIASTQTTYVTRTGVEVDKGKSFIDAYLEDSDSMVPKNQVVLSLANATPQKVTVGGYKVSVVTAEPDAGKAGLGEIRGGGGGGSTIAPRTRTTPMNNGKIVFYARSQAAQKAIFDLLSTLVETKNTTRKPSLWVADSWGGWRSQEAPLRKIESVVLKKGLKEEILGDLSKFLNDEKKYVNLGIPYHRGYLFHGPAGTGKTSMIKALAAELGLDLWYAPLGDLKEDSSLVDLIRSVKARGILLLEDVDSYAAAQDRESDDKSESDAGMGVSTSALLNALDGVVTPHGLITIMTTNHIDKLDPALIRNGRADKVVELGLPSLDEISELWNLFFPKSVGEIQGGTTIPGLSQAEVSEIFKSNWENPLAAKDALNSALALRLS